MKIKRSEVSLDREQVALALRGWREEVDLRAYGATCPMPHCGALVVTYESPDSLREIIQSQQASWEFVCAECGAEFTSSRGDLLFQSVPREWLFSAVSHA
jgi:hypothetical protein